MGETGELYRLRWSLQPPDPRVARQECSRQWCVRRRASYPMVSSLGVRGVEVRGDDACFIRKSCAWTSRVDGYFHRLHSHLRHHCTATLTGITGSELEMRRATRRVIALASPPGIRSLEERITPAAHAKARCHTRGNNEDRSSSASSMSTLRRDDKNSDMNRMATRCSSSWTICSARRRGRRREARSSSSPAVAPRVGRTLTSWTSQLRRRCGGLIRRRRQSPTRPRARRSLRNLARRSGTSCLRAALERSLRRKTRRRRAEVAREAERETTLRETQRSAREG